MGELRLRPEVAAFAQLMEQALRDNDHKGGWKDCRGGYLWTRLQEEVEELGEAMDAVAFAQPMEDRGDIPIFRKVLALGREAADVANFAMMIADTNGALKLSRRRSPKGWR
jgi:hypothetical protein